MNSWYHRAIASVSDGDRAARGAVLALSVVLIGLLTVAVAGRVGHPYELEWMEGAMVDHVARIMRGETVYVAPSLEFVPFVYPPMFYVLSAAVSKVTGLGFTALRVVSVLATMANLGWVYAIVRRETGQVLPGVAACGFFAGTYPLSGYWFDIGRVDSLFVSFLLAAMHTARFRHRWVAVAGSATLLTLAFFTKQSALVMVLAIGLAMVRVEVRRAMWFGALTAAMVFCFSVVVDTLHQGWYGYYTHRVVAGHALAWGLLPVFFKAELLMPCGVALGVSAMYFCGGRESGGRWFHGLCLVGLIAVGLMGRVHTGGWINVLMPAHAGVAIVFGLGMGAWWEAERGRLGSVLAVVQLVALGWDPRPTIPTEADRRAGDGLVAGIRSVPGDVWLTHRGHLARLAGKEPRAHMMAILDVMRSSADFRGSKARLTAEAGTALMTGRFDVVLMDNDDFWFLPVLQAHYRRDGRNWVEDPRAFWPRAGARIRPEVGYVPSRREVE